MEVAKESLMFQDGACATARDPDRAGRVLGSVLGYDLSGETITSSLYDKTAVTKVTKT